MLCKLLLAYIDRLIKVEQKVDDLDKCVELLMERAELNIEPKEKQ